MSDGEWRDGDARLRKIFGYLLRDHVAYQDGRNSEAPSVVFADGDYEVGDGTCGLHPDGKQCNEPAIIYVRADALVDALSRAEKAEAERDALRDREKHFASVLSVADRGQYRNDWDAAIRRVVAERDALREALRRLLSSPAISDGDQADPEWGCSETYAAEINARAALNREAGA